MSQAPVCVFDLSLFSRCRRTELCPQAASAFVHPAASATCFRFDYSPINLTDFPSLHLTSVWLGGWADSDYGPTHRASISCTKPVGASQPATLIRLDVFELTGAPRYLIDVMRCLILLLPASAAAAAAFVYICCAWLSPANASQRRLINRRIDGVFQLKDSNRNIVLCQFGSRNIMPLKPLRFHYFVRCVTNSTEIAHVLLQVWSIK